MPPVRVDPDTYEAASTTFGQDIANALFDTYTTLQSALEGSGGMAGTDNAGAAWGASYDTALPQLNAVTEDVINGCYQLAALLEATGFNHGTANDASTPGGERDVVDAMDYADSLVSLGGFQTASGSDGSDEPTGWHLVESAVGYVWPNGHQDKLRAAASAWSKAAQSVTFAADWVPSAVDVIQSQQSPEAADAVTSCGAMGGHLADLSSAYNDMSTSCTQYAGYIDKAHSDAIGELKSLVEWTVGIEAGGAILGFFTAGISEAAAQGVEAGRIAATAARIASIIEHLIELAGDVAKTIEGIASKAIEISSKLKVLLGARISKITAELVAKLPTTAKTAEELADDALVVDSKIQPALDYALNPKNLGHVFDKAEHDLDGLVASSGGEEQAMRKIIESVGDIPDGVYGPADQFTRVVDGYTVTIRGAMINGVFKIGTAFIAP